MIYKKFLAAYRAYKFLANGDGVPLPPPTSEDEDAAILASRYTEKQLRYATTMRSAYERKYGKNLKQQKVGGSDASK